jgi:hypothetical protein
VKFAAESDRPLLRVPHYTVTDKRIRFAEDRYGLMRDLTNAATKEQVTILDATHIIQFETHRFDLYNGDNGPNGRSKTGEASIQLN